MGFGGYAPFNDFHRYLRKYTHRLGPSPTEKLAPLLPVRGQGVIPDRVLPYPGNSVHVTPDTDSLRVAWTASMEIPPSPSTKPKEMN